VPAYNSPLLRPQLVQKGVPCYLLGSLNMLQGDTKGYVTQTAIATNVGTVNVSINQGPIPKVGDLITIWSTALQTGLFNVVRAVITAVTITAATGQGTISFALTGTNQSAAADPGAFETEPGEVGETPVAGASQACLIQAPSGDSQFTVPVAVTFTGGVLPTAITVTLQVAVRDVDAEYTNTSTAVVVAAGAYSANAGPVVQATLQRAGFYRLKVSGLTAGSATGIIGKIGG
jgi:hypothetical protein